MRKILLFGVLAALILALAGCDAPDDNDAKSGERSADTLNIVCSLFPQYDFTRAIAGEHARVSQLLPPGIDSHEFEPSAREMLGVADADMFIYTDPALEGWVKRLADTLKGVQVVSCAQGIDLEALNAAWHTHDAHADEHEHEHEDEHEHAYDAHIWLDPTLAVVMCQNIRAALIAADPAHASDYEANCAALINQLNALDADIEKLFAAHPEAELFFGGKFAYSHFLRRYGARYSTAYATCADEGEPGARVIIDIANAMKTRGAQVIFTDEMSSGAVARAIAEQTGARVVVFHTCHNLSAEDVAKGLTYIDIMRENLANLEAAIG